MPSGSIMPKSRSNDPRVRRAMHLALDRHALVEVVKDVTPTLVGGFTYPFSEFAASTEEQAQAPGLSARCHSGH